MEKCVCYKEEEKKKNTHNKSVRICMEIHYERERNNTPEMWMNKRFNVKRRFYTKLYYAQECKSVAEKKKIRRKLKTKNCIFGLAIVYIWKMWGQISNAPKKKVLYLRGVKLLIKNKQNHFHWTNILCVSENHQTNDKSISSYPSKRLWSTWTAETEIWSPKREINFECESVEYVSKINQTVSIVDFLIVANFSVFFFFAPHLDKIKS